MEHKQLNLFADSATKSFTLPPRLPQLVMSVEALEEWKRRIQKHQQQDWESGAPQQRTLFDLKPAQCDRDSIDPFSLPPMAMSFYRLPVQDAGSACIYFIIDSVAPLLLYVGETCQSNRRWKGKHDCKDYIMAYVQLHRKHGLDVAVNAAFWWGAPTERKARQVLELALIKKWRSPFNKENWELWGQPFKA